MKCISCNNTLLDSDKFCSKCGVKTSPVETIHSKAGKSKQAWYQTGWAWFWLIIFWPVGIYGLVKRAKPQHQKWWWAGIAAFLLAIILTPPPPKQSSSASVSKYPKSTSSYSDWKICVNHAHWGELAAREGMAAAEDRKWRICGTEP
ncbi:zinc ribbon domain-containing protein [Microbulbifer variabilis]|uniref:zinc ribbon domain-containing protein n=1 Tax=Microbulbifer variabilis TaxID=266805 RepID=UPI0003817580|nr:zinc ribbon domain-containing protein [Microbulbifer variabilis]